MDDGRGMRDDGRGTIGEGRERLLAAFAYRHDERRRLRFLLRKNRRQATVRTASARLGGAGEKGAVHAEQRRVGRRPPWWSLLLLHACARGARPDCGHRRLFNQPGTRRRGRYRRRRRRFGARQRCGRRDDLTQPIADAPVTRARSIRGAGGGPDAVLASKDGADGACLHRTCRWRRRRYARWRLLLGRRRRGGERRDQGKRNGPHGIT